VAREDWSHGLTVRGKKDNVGPALAYYIWSEFHLIEFTEIEVPPERVAPLIRIEITTDVPNLVLLNNSRAAR
jgi:hypothetical protein